MTLASGTDEAAKANPSVLVVDDEEGVRQFTVGCLEANGFAVWQASGAIEALELMMVGAPSVVLCDVAMPDKDGLWLLERLHAQWPETPVVMAAGLDDAGTLRKSRELGAVDYVTKPVKAERLLTVLRRATGIPDEASRNPGDVMPGSAASPQKEMFEAEYALEMPVRCPACGEHITTLAAVRLVRSQVNFTSTLPRRGRVMVCPRCYSMAPAELTNF